MNRIILKMKSEKSKNKVFRADKSQTEMLMKAGRKGAIDAVRASKALGLSITYLEKGVIYMENPDGSKEVLKKIQTTAEKRQNSLKLRKGMIFHAKD